MAHVANQQQTASVQRQLTAVSSHVLTIRIHGTAHRVTTLLEFLNQRAFHQAKPVAINHRLVFSINRGDRVLTVLDGCYSRFNQHVLYTGFLVFTHSIFPVDLNFHVQAIVLQQHTGRISRIAGVADKLFRRGKPD